MNYYTVQAFSHHQSGGNPAAVVINQSLSDVEKQAIARKIGFSETAFLQQQNDQLHIEFFTPAKPIPYCGHATIGSMNLLRQLNLLGDGDYLLQTRQQPIPVAVNEQSVFMQQPYPVLEEIDLKEVAAILQTPEENIVKAVIARNGVGYLLIELENDDLLYNLEPDEKKVYDISARLDLIGIYPFVGKDKSVLSRMFAPYYNIPEENATGMAAGLLGGWLHQRSKGNIRELLIEQGHSATVQEKGYLQVRIESLDDQYRVWVGGEAVVKTSADIDLLN